MSEVCEHGSLKRQCMMCDLMNEIKFVQTDMFSKIEKLEADRDRLSALAERYRQALEKIHRSAPCKKDHESFNTPGQPCDQRIAEEALSPEGGKGK